MTIKRDQKFVWVTWLSKLMPGETSCEFSAWFKANYTKHQKAPSNINLAKWQIDHTKMLRELKYELEEKGCQVFKETQNQFRYTTKSGIIISGKPDLISKLDNNSIGIYDCKTGQERSSDQIQVMLYMYYLSLTPGYKAFKSKGFVVYKENRIELPYETIDNSFKENINYFLDILNSNNPLSKSPAKEECGYCDISKEDCPERI